jgi:hypothetical protein
MQFLRIILIIVLVYYLLKIFTRYLLPIMAKYLIKKTIETHQRQYAHPAGKKGDIHIKYPEKKSRNQDKLGEYIDYEELNED